MSDFYIPEVLAVSETPMLRRKALGALGLAGMAWIASSNAASAFISSKSSQVPTVRVPTSANTPRTTPAVRYQRQGLPEEWVRLHAHVLPEYEVYLNRLRLKNLSPNQVIRAHAKQQSGIWNTLPPKHWWNRMGYTLRVLDRVSAAVGSPVEEVCSAYRSPAYNRCCPGAKRGSWHQANVAVDVKFSQDARRVTAIARHLRDRGLFKGGVGSYSNFTHIDTRGQNVNW